MTISFLCYEPIPDRDGLARRMEHVSALGYGGIELTATYPLSFEVDDVLRLSERHRLPVVSILSGWSYGNEGLCLCHPDKAVRDRAVARLIDYVGMANRFRSLLVVGLMQGLRSDEPDESKANGRIAEGLRRVADAAADKGVTIVLEPVNHLQVGFNNSADEAAAMADRVGSCSFSFMLDTIHMNIEERSMFDAIRDHGRRARHVHLCETNGGPFGSGALDFPRVLAAFDAAGFDGFASVKVYRKLRWDEAARHSAEFLRGLGVDLVGRS